MGVYEHARKETREKIIREFWKLYKKYPISKITIQQVADACGVHRSTIYFHFRDLYEILESIEEMLLEQIRSIDIRSGDSLERLVHSGKLLFDEYRKNRSYLRLLVMEHRDHDFSVRYREEMIHMMSGIVLETPEKAGNLDKKVVNLTSSVIIEAFLQCADDDAFSFEDTLKIMQGFMLQGYYETIRETFHVKGLRNPLSVLM